MRCPPKGGLYERVRAQGHQQRLLTAGLNPRPSGMEINVLPPNFRVPRDTTGIPVLLSILSGLEPFATKRTYFTEGRSGPYGIHLRLAITCQSRPLGIALDEPACELEIPVLECDRISSHFGQKNGRRVR